MPVKRVFAEIGGSSGQFRGQYGLIFHRYACFSAIESGLEEARGSSCEYSGVWTWRTQAQWVDEEHRPIVKGNEDRKGPVGRRESG